MGTLMGQHIGGRIRFQVRGQIDSGIDHAQNKGGMDVVTDIDPVPNVDGCRHLLFQPQVTDQRPQEHDPHTQTPDDLLQEQMDLNGVDTGPRHGHQTFHHRVVHCLINDIHTAVNGRGLGIDDGFWNGFPAGDQTQGALDGNRADQPHRHQCPQGNGYPLGALFQRKPQRQYRKHQP